MLGAKEYSTAIDMWSVGCIMAELIAKETLFRGKSELEQLDKVIITKITWFFFTSSIYESSAILVNNLFVCQMSADFSNPGYA